MTFAEHAGLAAVSFVALADASTAMFAVPVFVYVHVNVSEPLLWGASGELHLYSAIAFAAGEKSFPVTVNCTVSPLFTV